MKNKNRIIIENVINEILRTPKYKKRMYCKIRNNPNKKYFSSRFTASEDSLFIINEPVMWQGEFEGAYFVDLASRSKTVDDNLKVKETDIIPYKYQNGKFVKA